MLGAKLLDVKQYDVAEMDAIRYALVVAKNSATSSKYPRGMNKPRLKPLN